MDETLNAVRCPRGGDDFLGRTLDCHAADKPGFVSTTTLQVTGGYALEVGLSKPVTIRSAKSARLKPGQA